MNQHTKVEKEKLIKDAKKEMAVLESMKLLIKADNDCEAVLRIDGVLSHGFSTSNIFLKVINQEIREIQKAIDGKTNKWQ